MRLETIIRAAIRDVQAGRAKPHCGELPSWVRADDPLSEISWAQDYAEPGYDTPRAGVLFGNWNNYPSRLTDILEKAGYSIEWEDEWGTCESCNRAVRTSPDSYGWKPAYVLYHECDIVCRDCVREDLDEYETHLLNHASRADTFGVDWEERGFVKFNDYPYENGLHPGQNDTPADIVKQIPKGHDYLFSIPSVGQFDISFDCWIRSQTED